MSHASAGPPAMQPLARQICLNHPAREASAKCLECGNFFCHECVTEHEGRVICSECLTTLTRVESRRRLPALTPLWRAAQLFASLMLLWVLFYWLGALLLMIPSEFHDGRFIEWIEAR